VNDLPIFQIAVVLLNARMSLKSFNRWSLPLGLQLVSLMLSKLSLVIPLSTIQAVRFQLLHAPPQIIHFAGDLKYGMRHANFSLASYVHESMFEINI
jgi:3-deoxy-D-manno-octulosonic-acid transferase